MRIFIPALLSSSCGLRQPAPRARADPSSRPGSPRPTDSDALPRRVRAVGGGGSVARRPVRPLTEPLETEDCRRLLPGVEVDALRRSPPEVALVRDQVRRLERL